jgi:hypothetical protein
MGAGTGKGVACMRGVRVDMIALDDDDEEEEEDDDERWVGSCIC